MKTLNNCLVAVDVRSAHNVGAFFRTCDGLGADLCLIGITPYPLELNDERLPHVASKVTNSISKTALGAENSVKWYRYENLTECVKDLKRRGYEIIALEQSPTSKDIKELIKNKPTAIIVGREVTGLNQSELKLCDDVYEIPMQGMKESFNVSVAAAIALYQISIF